MPAWARRYYQRWLSRRIPAARELTLDQRRIFIFPSKAGFAFLGLLLLLLLTAINYESNLVFALTFLLASLMFVAVHASFANLSGIRLQTLNSDNAYAGEPVAFRFRLSAKRPRFAIQLGWPESGLGTVSFDTAADVELFLTAARRGRLKAPRLLIQSVYPLGLLRTWSWLDMDAEALVYPRPLEGELPAAESDGDSARHGRREGEELADFRDYQVGDSLKRLHWKGLARGGPLMTRLLEESGADPQLLDWASTTGSIEQRLSVLCYHVLRADTERRPIGLILPSESIEAECGAAHRERLLQALALYGEPGGADEH